MLPAGYSNCVPGRDILGGMGSLWGCSGAVADVDLLRDQLPAVVRYDEVFGDPVTGG